MSLRSRAVHGQHFQHSTHQHAFLAIPRPYPEYYESASDQNDAGVGQEAGLYNIMLHLLD